MDKNEDVDKIGIKENSIIKTSIEEGNKDLEEDVVIKKSI